MEGRGVSLAQIIARPDWTFADALRAFPEHVLDHGEDINQQIETEIKYAGYIERQKKEVAKLEHLDSVRIPKTWDYAAILGLRTEARQKLIRFTPENLGQASRIPGVTASDISVLLVALKSRG